jgi:membrane-associated phospholipid phosphatase
MSRWLLSHFTLCWHDLVGPGSMLRRTRVRIRKLFAALGLFSLEFLLITVLFLAAIFIFSFLVKQVFIDRQQEFDVSVFAWIHTYESPATTSLMRIITFMGTHYFLIPANMILTAYYIFIRRHRWYSIKVASIALSSTAIMLLLKQFFSRPRPLVPLLEAARGYSFPSGHSLVSFAFYGLLIYLCWHYLENRTLRWLYTLLLSALILFIGLSRIYLRVHYATDVIAGFSIGMVWLVLSIYILNRMEAYSKRRLEPVVEEVTDPMRP